MNQDCPLCGFGLPFLLSVFSPSGFARLCELPLWVFDAGCSMLDVCVTGMYKK